MARLLIALVSLAPLVALAPAATVPAHLFPKEPPLAFPTKVGTTWVYAVIGSDREFTHVISNVEEKDGTKLVTIEEVNRDGKRSPNMVQLLGPAWRTLPQTAVPLTGR